MDLFKRKRLSKPAAKTLQDDQISLSEELGALREQLEQQRAIIGSHQALLSRIFMSEELRPVGELKCLQELCVKLLRFVDLVCQKHDIEYWLDCGTLLGSIRHNGFIPWDDDIDIAMTRPHYRRFLLAFDEEVDRLELNKYLFPTRLRSNAERSRLLSGHLQIKLGNGKMAPIMVDVFPYDSIGAEAAETLVPSEFKRARSRYARARELTQSGIISSKFGDVPCALGGDMTEEELSILAKHSASLGILLDSEGPLIPGLDSVKYGRPVPRSTLFPLTKVQFSGHEFLAPNNPRTYLKGIYGDDYLELPEVIEVHSRLKWLRRNRDTVSAFDELTGVIDSTNQRF